MRRKDREITDLQQKLKIIAACDVCRVAMFDEAYPYIVPMNFGEEYLDGKLNLYFHAAREGKKLDLIRKNSMVCFEMDTAHQLIPGKEAQHCTMKYQSVMGRGNISILEGDEKTEGLICLMKHYFPDRAEFSFDPRVVEITAVLKLSVEDFTAKVY